VSLPGKTGRSRRARKRMSAVGGKKALRALLLVAGCVAAGAGLGAGAKASFAWVTTSPRLAIREVAVRTGERVPEKEVRMLADIKVGDNILGFRLSECVSAIEIHPWVRRASVMRELPDRVVIDIEERKPLAAVALGSLYYLDEQGEIFKKILPGESVDFPVITGISLWDAVEEKETIDLELKNALEILSLSGQSGIVPLAAVSEVNLDRTYGATLVRADDGMRIRFGLGDFPDKWARMERTLVELGSEASKVFELDLNYQGRVTVRLRDGYRVASAEGPVGL